ncbi:MAG TPA: nucleotidyltransferase family protein [Conexibacter sp.]
MGSAAQARSAILADIAEETIRLLGAAEQADVPVRALGGMAVVLRVGEKPPALRRGVEDIDLAVPKGQGRGAARFLAAQGYAPNEAFNATHGAQRMIFDDHGNDRHVDVFIGRFQMCHELVFDDRLALDRHTLPLAELVMTKLQIVRLNEKDLLDLYALLLAFEVADHDRDAINGERIAALCARDWGTYRTFTGNLARLPGELERYELDEAQRVTIAGRARALGDAIERVPKSGRWKVRARIGDRVRWYEDPEEVGADAN